MSNAAPLYELVLEATASSDEVSLRRLRAALVTDLELPVEEAKKALTAEKAVLQRSHNSADLERARDVLLRAGATVHIQEVPTMPTEPIPGLSMSETPEQAGAESALDPLDQISDLFRDLDEFRVHKAAPAAVVAPALPAVLSASASDTSDSAVPSLGGPRRRAPSEPWWKQVVSIPEILFSIGFSLVIVVITSLMYSP